MPWLAGCELPDALAGLPWGDRATVCPAKHAGYTHTHTHTHEYIYLNCEPELPEARASAVPARAKASPTTPTGDATSGWPVSGWRVHPVASGAVLAAASSLATCSTAVPFCGLQTECLIPGLAASSSDGIW